MSKSNKQPTIPWPKSKEYWRTHNSGEIAEELGCHRNTVCQHRLMHDLPSPPRKGGPGATPRISDEDFDLSKPIAWNAKKVKCTINWAGERMRRLKARLAAVKPKKGKASDWL